MNFTIRGLLWLTVGIAGIVAAAAAVREGVNKAIYYLPYSYPEPPVARIHSQFIVGLVLLGLAFVFGFLRRAGK